MINFYTFARMPGATLAGLPVQGATECNGTVNIKTPQGYAHGYNRKSDHIPRHWQGVTIPSNEVTNNPTKPGDIFRHHNQLIQWRSNGRIDYFYNLTRDEHVAPSPFEQACTTLAAALANIRP